MANGMMKKGGGGRETVLESRHVVGMFLGVVVLCGVFFTLGFVMGRTQNLDAHSSVRAANAPSPQPPEKTAPVVPASSSWDFMKSSEAKKPEGKLEPAPPAGQPAASGSRAEVVSSPVKPEKIAAATPAKSAPAAKPGNVLYKAPVIPRGQVVLQIAALTRESDALAIAEALQQKEFPAFVLTPATGNLYRVQVGPYAEGKAADAAKKALEREGFKAITKR